MSHSDISIPCSRIALLYGLHGSEAVGSALIVTRIKSFLLALFPDLDIHVFGPLSPWSAARSFRFDSDLVDPNRVFACPRVAHAYPEQLDQFHNLWHASRPLSESQILSFIDACGLHKLPLEALLSLPQSVYPGLPGFCLSPAINRYQSLVDNLVSAIISDLPIGSDLLIVDVHLGIGEHARTTIHAEDPVISNPLPQGSFLGEVCCRLRANGFLPRAVISETGCLSNLHALLNLFQELSHRCFSTSSVIVPLRPLVDSTWRHALDVFLLGDLRDIFRPLLP